MTAAENRATDEGRALGAHLARFADIEASKFGRDDRCSTCAFRAGDHIANGSPETLMTALKCVMEREVFWCHEHARPCAGYQLLKVGKGATIEMPWDAIDGFDVVQKP